MSVTLPGDLYLSNLRDAQQDSSIRIIICTENYYHYISIRKNRLLSPNRRSTAGSEHGWEIRRAAAAQPNFAQIGETDPRSTEMVWPLLERITSGGDDAT
jgi:hypothetical protein